MIHGIHPDAGVELGDAAVYYAAHASRGIAEAFPYPTLRAKYPAAAAPELNTVMWNQLHSR